MKPFDLMRGKVRESDKFNLNIVTPLSFSLLELVIVTFLEGVLLLIPGTRSTLIKKLKI